MLELSIDRVYIVLHPVVVYFTYIKTSLFPMEGSKLLALVRRFRPSSSRNFDNAIHAMTLSSNNMVFYDGPPLFMASDDKLGIPMGYSYQDPNGNRIVESVS